MALGKENNPNSLAAAIDWLASLRITVYTLIALGLATLLGTIFPQVGVTIPPQVLKAKMAAEPLWRALHLLGVVDVFHSVWFLFLVGLLMLNLIACTVRYLGRMQRMLDRTGVVLDQSAEAGAQATRRVPSANVDRETLKDSLARLGSVTETQTDGKTHWFAQSSPLVRYSLVIVHLSILLVLAGALVRIFLAVEGQINLPEGGSANVFESDQGELLRLPFDIECDKFAVEFYEGGQRPKEFSSALVLRENGTAVREKTIQVNDPLKYAGFRFFQASYGAEHFALLHVTGQGVDRTLPVIFQQVHSVPGSRAGFLLDAARRTDAGVELHLQLSDGQGQSFEAWLPEAGAAQPVGPYNVAFTGSREGFYTGLLVSADPSIPLLWAGFGLFLAGLLASMFTSHRRVWVRFDESEVVIAASASRRRPALERWLDAVVVVISKGKQ
jgi:cytochrome c biogenesis protein